MKNKILKSGLLFLCIGIFVHFTGAQTTTDVFSIRAYDFSLALSLKNSTSTQFAYNSYGENLLSRSTDAGSVNRYSFHGQEFDENLNLHFFPSRFYDSKAKRFLLPDSKSQYHSPYVFVGGDPVNYVDINGNEGKPLVLYGEDHRIPGSLDLPTQDLMADFPNAHYVPLSDFVNGKVGDLPEWNGNVFIKAHMGSDRRYEIGAERAFTEDELKTESLSAVQYPLETNGYSTALDAEDFGGMLRKFSEDRDVPIKNIVAGGCEGEDAAQRIYEGFMEEGAQRAEASASQELNVMGLKKGNRAMFAGEKSVKGLPRKFDGPYFKSRFHVRPIKAQKLYMTVKNPDGSTQLTRFGQEFNGEYKPLQFIEGEQLNQFLNGRAPDNIMKEMSVFKGFY